MSRLRWKLCKIWNCKADDERFSEITREQWAWYAQMLYQDESEQYDYHLSLTEYMASFWNAEAVKKIRDARESADDPRFMDDKEFEQQILSRSFRDDHIVQSIKEKYKNTNLYDKDRARDGRNVRLPKNPTGLFDLTKE